MRRRVASGRSRSQRGAVVVEFALCSTLLFPLVFGLIDYGVWFADSGGAKSGVREGARRAVVQQAATASCATDTSYPSDLDKMRCQTRAAISTIAGHTYVMVRTSSSGWVKGSTLSACAMVEVTGVTGLVPLPNNRIVYSRVDMSIESATTVPSGASGPGAHISADTLPAGFAGNWAWCA